MASDLRTVTIGDLCGAGEASIQTGPFGSQLHAEDYVDGGVPVVPTEAIVDRRIDHSRLPTIAAAKAESLARHALLPGDILFARRGVQATGHSALVTEDETGFVCGTGAIRLRLRLPTSPVSPRYLSYVLADPASIRWFKHHAIGATMPNLNEGIVRSFSFAFPGRDDQEAICTVLDSLDCKIELNRKMSATLEATARALFTAWFVDFYPVRAKAAGRDTGFAPEIADLFPDALEREPCNLGLIPLGWRSRAVSEVLDVNPSTSLAGVEIAPYLDMANVPTRGFAVKRVVDRHVSSGSRFTNGDTLLARITPCLENGKTTFVDFLDDAQIGWGSTEFMVLRPHRPLPAEYGYLLARDEGFRKFAIGKMTGSSGRQRVPADALDSYFVASPPDEVAEAFGGIVTPFFKRMTAANVESRTLAALRDALLPKLISGELRVSEAERILEKSA